MTHPRNWPTHRKAVAALTIVAVWLVAASHHHSPPSVAVGLRPPGVGATGVGLDSNRENSR